MSGFFATLMVLAMVAVLGALGVGLVTMVRGGEANARVGNKMMRLRVILQGVALLLFALAFLFAR